MHAQALFQQSDYPIKRTAKQSFAHQAYCAERASRYERKGMRFLYSHRTRSADGQYVHIRELTDALRARSHEIILSGPGQAQEKTLDAGSGRGLLGRLPAPVYELAEYGYSFSAFQRLSKFASAAKPDVLYERYNLFFHAGVWAARRAGLPLLLEVNAPLAEERARHGGLALKSFAHKSEAAIWCAADVVLPVTRVLADRVRAAGVPDNRIEVVQNGVSASFLTDRNPSKIRERYGLQERLILGFAGFVRDWHGVERAIRFLAAQDRADLYLLIVGDGPARPALMSLAVNLGVADRMTVTGVVQREEIPDYIAAFDIALQPAVVEYASPLKLFEYMALGKAIVAPSSANIGEILKDGEDALLFSLHDDSAFDNALAALVKDASLRARLGAAARESLIRRNLTWDGNAGRIETIAERLIGRTT